MITSNKSTEKIPLIEEIFAIILSFLKPKFILQCRLVCKHWDQTITNSQHLWNDVPVCVSRLEIIPKSFMCKLSNVIWKKVYNKKDSKYIRQFSNLKKLHLKGDTSIAMEHVASLSTLQDLNFDVFQRNADFIIEPISRITSLLKLNVQFTFITDKRFQSFSKLTLLQALEMGNCWKITDQGIQYLSKFIHLQRLNVSSCYKVTNVGLEALSALTKMTHLQIAGYPSISDLGFISRLTALCYLDLNGSYQLTDQGLKPISNVTSLQHLDLSKCTKITDISLKCFSNFKSLSYLSLLNCSEITDKGMQFISMLTSLRHLDLSNCNLITNNGLNSISDLRGLRYLILRNCSRISDLSVIPNFTSLCKLILSECNITDEEVKKLSNLVKLEVLDVKGCNGVSVDILSSLIRLTRLREVKFTKFTITERGLNSFIDLHPPTSRRAEDASFYLFNNIWGYH